MAEQDEKRPGAQEWVPEDGGIDDMRHAAQNCRGCELWRNATQVVFSKGSAAASMMIVGEQPGDREDLAGEPFVGPAGRVLADAVDAAHLDHDDLYMTNAVKHFRFERRGKRRIHDKPAVGHIVACHPWLEAEADVVRPEVIVVLGTTAARAVLGRTVKIGEERGSVLDPPPGFMSPVVVTTHPSSILRIRDSVDRETAFEALVEDLRVAAELAAH